MYGLKYAQKYAQLLSVSFASIKQYYDEKYDRSNFVKNVILDNILPGDIHIKARELHFNNETTRAVLLIRITEPGEVSIFDVIQNLFPDKNKDFVFNITETDIVLVKELKPGVETKEIEKMAERVYAARLLMEGNTYNQVISQADISSATLSRVSRCVQYGSGYSKLLKEE